MSNGGFTAWLLPFSWPVFAARRQQKTHLWSYRRWVPFEILLQVRRANRSAGPLLWEAPPPDFANAVIDHGAASIDCASASRQGEARFNIRSLRLWQLPPTTKSSAPSISGANMTPRR